MFLTPSNRHLHQSVKGCFQIITTSILAAPVCLSVFNVRANARTSLRSECAVCEMTQCECGETLVASIPIGITIRDKIIGQLHDRANYLTLHGGSLAGLRNKLIKQIEKFL